MRIVHVIDKVDPLDGGPPAALVRLAAAQQQNGWQPVIVARGVDGQAQRCESAFGRVPGYGKLQFDLVHAGDVFERLFAPAAGETLERHIAAADIVHVHGLWRPILMRAIRAARKLGRPYVVSPHGMLSPWSLAQKRLKKRLAVAFFWRHAMRNAAFVHVLNEDEQAAAMSLVGKHNFLVAPNGVFLEEYDDAAPTMAGGPGGGRRHIVFVGRLHYSKGLDLLMDAYATVAAQSPDLDLLLIGPDFGYRAEIERLVAARQLTGRVHLPGPVFGDAKIALLKSAECFCLPSRQEGFSVAVLEALACRTPVVISDACRFSQDDLAGGGHVVPLDAGAIATALERLCANRRLRDQCASRARLLVESQFMWGRIAQTLGSAYREVLAARLAGKQPYPDEQHA